MARTLEVEAHDDEGTVTIWIRSDAERDLSVHVDGLDVIQQIAARLDKQVSVSSRTGDVDASGDA